MKSGCPALALTAFSASAGATSSPKRDCKSSWLAASSSGVRLSTWISTGQLSVGFGAWVKATASCSRGAVAIAVASEGDREIEEKADVVIPIPDLGDYLTSVVATIPLQLLAYHVAVLKGTDVDQPRNLAKSVTVE